MCAPVAGLPGQRPGQELRSASTSIPGPKHPVSRRSRARACSLSRYGPGMPRAGSPSPTPPPPATAPAGTPRHGPGWTAAEMRGVGFFVRHVRRRPVDRHDPVPAAEHPGGTVLADRPGDLLEQEPDRCRAELAAASRQREMFGCRHRRPCPASTQPPGSICCPSSRSPRAAGDTARRQLGHHLPVPAVPPTATSQHEVHHQPRRTAPLPRPPAPPRVHQPYPPTPPTPTTTNTLKPSAPQDGNDTTSSLNA